MITNDLFAAFLHCKREAFLKAAGGVGEPTDFERVHLGLERVYREQALAAFLGPHGEADVMRDPPSLAEAIRRQPEREPQRCPPPTLEARHRVGGGRRG
jgi:hypothetical protein